MHIPLLRILDRVKGGMICLALGLLPKRKPVPVRRILCIQLWGLGETTLTLPALSALKRKYPKAEIDILATPRNAAIYAQQPFHTIVRSPLGVLLFGLANCQRYDLVIDFEEYLRIPAVTARLAGKYAVGFATNIRGRCFDKTVSYDGTQHTAETFLDLVRALGIRTGPAKLAPLILSSDEKKAADRFMKTHNLPGFIGVAPFVAESSPQRAWPFFDDLVPKLKHPVVVFGSPDELQKVSWKGVVLAELPLRQSIALLSKAELLIANDSGLLHIAAAQGVPTIGIFGPNIPARWRPLSRGSAPVYKGYWCSPCINSHLGQFPPCRYGKDVRCLRRISAEDVLAQVKNSQHKVY
ncbi:MAG: glycosyltransferase family 9 protein [Nanoarchaeota archaeon]